MPTNKAPIGSIKRIVPTTAIDREVSTKLLDGPTISNKIIYFYL